jgi:hypothetical protein
MLRHYVSRTQSDWDEWLDTAEFAINNSKHASTGTTPFKLNFGRSPGLPLHTKPDGKVPAAADFVKHMQHKVLEARTCNRLAQQRQARYYNQHHQLVEHDVGDWVLLNSKDLHFKCGTPKLLPRWVGPFEIVKRVGKLAYELKLPRSWRIHDVFHVGRLQAYRSDGSVQPPPPMELLDGEAEYEVERVLQHKDVKCGKKIRTEYLVGWRGSSAEHNTWEPAGNLRNASALVQEYWEEKEAKGTSSSGLPDMQIAAAVAYSGSPIGEPLPKPGLVIADLSQSNAERRRLRRVATLSNM